MIDPTTPAAPTAPPGHSLPLARLIGHTADAVQAVRAGRSLNDALARCPAEARPGAQALSFHALRWLGSAQVVRGLLAPKNPPPAVDALLLTALALAWPASVPPYPDHTLVDQAVSAARQRVPAAAGFVNAVLRRFLREREGLVAQALRDPLARSNHPAWWVERLARDWPDAAPQLLEADNLRPPMTLRVNARRSSAADYVARLAEHGIAAVALAGQAVRLAQPCPVTQLPGFAAGEVSVQDAAAQLAAPLLIGAGLPPGFARARRLRRSRRQDRAPARIGRPRRAGARQRCRAPCTRVTETLIRLGLQARTLAADAGEPAAWWDGQPFDAILLDAPCSASGIVRRHPDVRWLRRATDIDALARTQARLLDALWPLLREGGRLLYCSCSVFRAEGQQQIDAFFATTRRRAGGREPAFARPPAATARQWGRASVAGFQHGGRRVFPHPDRENPSVTPSAPGATTARPQIPAGRRRVALARALGAMLCWAILLLAPAGARADAAAELASFDVSRGDDGVLLGYAVRFELPRGAEDALNKAVPLYFVAEAEIFRDRWYWADESIAKATRQWRIVYQPLTLTYRVTFGGLSQTYPSRSEALAAISRNSRWKIAEPGVAADGARHYVEFSFRLDTSLLPRPMQIGISGQADWMLKVERVQRFN